MFSRRRAATASVLALAGLLSTGPAALAQFMGEPGGGAGEGGGRHHGPAPQHPANPPPARLAPKPPPRQRLDAGALLCPTEADLQQHASAIEARLEGRDAPEPSGCRFVRSTVAVAVLDRHGPAATQVRLPGENDVVGWTDAIIRGDVTAGK